MIDAAKAGPAAMAPPDRPGQDAAYRAAIDLSPAVHWRADARGRVTEVSERWHALTGLQPAAFLGFAWQKRLHADDRARVLAAYRQSIRSGQKLDLDCRVRLNGDKDRWVRLRAMAERDADGLVCCWHGTIEDIDERRRLANALQDMTATLEQRVVERTQQLETSLRERAAAQAERALIEQRLSIFIDEVTDYAIVMLEPNGLIANWNVGAERIEGYTAREVIGMHFRAFYTAEDQAAGLPEWALRTAVERGRFVHEGWRVRKDGSRFWAAVVLQPVRDGSGQLLGFTKITRDVTERRAAQRALDEAREQLFQAQKLEAVGQLTGGIAHDFNNLLQAISGALYLIRRRQLQGRIADIVHLVDHALTATERAAALTQRLLAFARRQPLDPRIVDANELIRSAMQLIQRTMRVGIEIRLDLAAELATIFCDPHQLETAIINLAVNARDAMPAGGALTIRTRNALPEGAAPGGEVLIEVADTGIGMERETLERAFEPFFTTKPVGQGTGLGLSMIHGFVHQSLGRVAIKSTPAVGTTVSIWLPRHDDSVPPADIHAEASDAPIPRRVVLVIEDDPLVRELLVAMLDEMGHEVIEAADGMSGLEQLQAPGRIDLLLTDLGLPGITGRKIVEAARPHRPDLPVILMSGYTHEVERPDEPLGPLMWLLPKPFTMASLAEQVRHALAGERD